jgi:hypothetical protein
MNCPHCGAALMTVAQFCSAFCARTDQPPQLQYQPGAFAMGIVSELVGLWGYCYRGANWKPSQD